MSPVLTELLENPWIQRVGFVVGGLGVGIVLEFVVIRRAHKLAECSASVCSIWKASVSSAAGPKALAGC